MGATDTTVRLSPDLYARLSDLLQRSGAESVDELVSRIARDWASKQASQGPAARPPLAADDEKVVEERLKSLGYL